MAKHEMDEIQDVSHIKNVGVAHEETDLSLSGIGKFVIHLIVLVAASAAIVYGMYRFFSGREYEQEQTEPPSTRLKREQRESGQVQDMSPQPRLQTQPIPDLGTFRAAEEKRLESYTWVDKEKGIVSNPIEEAKRKLLEQMKDKSMQPMPTPTGQTKPAATGAMTATPRQGKARAQAKGNQ